ncbi:MAG: hypothetical protein KGK07_07490 [Chloroflexota bacterium]|nr:hypothetical protein [Chloroflexota bacterium]
MRAGAPFYSGAITTRAVTTAQGTTGLADLALPGEASTLFDAGGVTMAVQNGADQTITGLTAFFSDPATGASITYDATTPSIAAGVGGAYYVAVNAGILPRLDVQVTFGTAPTAGKTVSVTAIVQGH